jgi:hypothetical protein
MIIPLESKVLLRVKKSEVGVYDYKALYKAMMIIEIKNNNDNNSIKYQQQ